MIFTETKLNGAFIIDLERREDPRGFFARAFCQQEFEEHGLKPVIAQANIAFNHTRARCAACTSSFRPPPRQSWCAAPAARSSISSSTCARKAPPISEHVAVELTEDNHRALYVPERFAHGYQVLWTRPRPATRSASFIHPDRRRTAV